MQSKVEIDSDILQPIPFEEWPELQNLLKYDWPTNSHYYYWIENSIKWKKQEPNLALQIYCPNGEYKDDLTFVGISSVSLFLGKIMTVIELKDLQHGRLHLTLSRELYFERTFVLHDFGMTSVVIFTKEKSGKRLYDALVKSERFDWSKNVTFIGVEEGLWPLINSALATLRIFSGVEIIGDLCCRFYINSAANCAKMKVKIPDECYLADLNPSHLPLINSEWPHCDKENPEYSLNFLRPAVTLNKSTGLFLKQGKILVSWALHNDWHGLGSMQTLDSYKRKGYAKIVIKFLAKRLGENGISPVTWVVCGNTRSEKMCASLDWKPFSLVRRITVIFIRSLANEITFSRFVSTLIRHDFIRANFMWQRSKSPVYKYMHCVHCTVPMR